MTRAAVEEGVVPGGGVALLRCQEEIDKLKFDDPDEETGAKIVSPPEDRSVREKRNSMNLKTKNEHEFDALVSAFYAYDKYQKTFRKIKNSLIKNNKIELLDYVITLVLLEEINIYKAVKILESKQ